MLLFAAVWEIGGDAGRKWTCSTIRSIFTAAHRKFYVHDHTKPADLVAAARPRNEGGVTSSMTIPKPLAIFTLTLLDKIGVHLDNLPTERQVEELV